MELTGTIKKLLDVRHGNSREGKPWKKKEFLLLYTDGQYEREILMQVMGEKIDTVLSRFNEGDTVTVQYNIESRYNGGTGSYFTNITAWRMDLV